MLQMVALMLTGLPILALAMMLGGIAPEALFVVYAITGSTIVAVAAISMAVSVWCKRAREAVATAYLVLLALLVVPMVLDEVIGAMPASEAFYGGWLTAVNGQFLAGNPLWVLGSASLQASGTGTEAAWQMVLVLARNQLLLAAAAVVWASVAVRRVHLRQLGKAEKRRRRFQLFRPSIAERPMLWKELFAAHTTSRLGMIGRIAVMLLVLCVVVPALYQFLVTIESPEEMPIEFYLIQLLYSTTAVACGMLLLLAARAAASVTSEKERETWDSLLATPLEPGEIINAKLLGNLYSVRWGLWVMVLLWTLGIPFRASFLVAGVFTLVVFFLLALFVTMLGVTFSLGAAEFDLGDGLHAGHLPVRRRRIPVLLHAIDDDRRRQRWRGNHGRPVHSVSACLPGDVYDRGGTHANRARRGVFLRNARLRDCRGVSLRCDQGDLRSPQRPHRRRLDPADAAPRMDPAGHCRTRRRTGRRWVSGKW